MAKFTIYPDGRGEVTEDAQYDSDTTTLVANARVLAAFYDHLTRWSDREVTVFANKEAISITVEGL